MSAAETPSAAEPPGSPPSPSGSLGDLIKYFLYLGTFGFGGPIALAGYMQRDLVERRNWIAKQDYVDGLALAQLAPGPLAAQLAIYLGWVKGRLIGAIGLSDPHGSLARAAGEPEDLLHAADHSLYGSKRKRSRQQEPATSCQGARAGGRDGR